MKAPVCIICGTPLRVRRGVISPRLCGYACLRVRIQHLMTTRDRDRDARRRAGQYGGRHRDPRALRAYVQRHPRCEMIACPEPPMAEPHHIISRARGGPDTASNLLRLCALHHVGNLGWHTWGLPRWLARLGDTVPTAVVHKIMTARASPVPSRHPPMAPRR